MANHYYSPQPFGAPYTPPLRKPMSRAAQMLIASLIALAVTLTGSAAALAGKSITDSIENGYEQEEGGSGGIPLSPEDEGWEAPAPNHNAPKVTISDPGIGTEVLTDAQIAAKVRPSVVGIVTYGEDADGEAEIYGQGSGVVLTADGYILTNAHVIDGGSYFLVIDHEGNYYDAKVVGSDSRTDLAVLRITVHVNLTPAEFGDSERVSVGDKAVAIGNPGGLSYASSVTFGHVSAVNRVITSSVNVFGLLQVDAAINPGNSGGALVNQWGQVIGINCAKVVAEDYEGIGFAIPISKAKIVFDTLMEYGYMKDRIRLGVSIIPVDTITAAFEGTRTGIQIVSLERDSVFSTTEVQPKDIIVAVDGVRITNSAEFFETMYTYKPRDKADFTMFRPATGNTYTVTVALQGAYE